MSEAIHFDTHRFVKRMTEAGMTEKAAEALADEQMQLLQGELATKQNLAENAKDLQLTMKDMDGRLQADLKQSEARLLLEIEKSKSELIRWMGGLLIAQGGVIIAMLRWLPA